MRNHALGTFFVSRLSFYHKELSSFLLSSRFLPLNPPKIIRLLFILLYTSLAACVSEPASAPPPTATFQPSATDTPAPPSFRIIGYVTEEAIVDIIPFDKLTHINYAFVIPKSDGTFSGVMNGWKLEAIVEKAHEHNVQVLVSVGGWGYDAEFEELAANPQTRATFVAGLVAFAAEYNLDGLDIDWEYPDPGDSSQNFLALMQELRAALPPGKLLTAAVVAQGETGAGVPAEAFEVVDFLNLMAYDASETDHSPYSFAQTSLNYWSQRGLPAEKMVLGVPFYARPTWAPYRELIEENPAAANQDTLEYMGQTVYYNGIPTMQQKTQLAMENASGIMIWALSHDTSDDSSLLSAIFQAVHQGNHD